MGMYDANLLARFTKPAKPNLRSSTIQAVTRELRERIDQQHAIRLSETLGCTVTILRREPVRGKSGKYLFSEPVYGMPAEFIEHAQSLGLLAEAR